MSKTLEYFWNRIFYNINVFFQLRWLLAFLLRFNRIRTIILKKKKVKIKQDGSVNMSTLFPSCQYDFTLRGLQLYMVIGITPLGLFFTKDIQSVFISIVLGVLVSVIPVVVINHHYLLKDSKVTKYYNLFEHDSMRNKKKWRIITTVFMFFLSIVFVFNWVIFVKLHN